MNTILLLLVLLKAVESNEEKVLYLDQVGKALNLTASYQLKKGDENQCLTECFYKSNCDSLNVEVIQKNVEYRCYIFVKDRCSIPNYNKYFIDAPNFKFYHTKQKIDCLSLRDAGVSKSGIHTIWPDGITKVNAYCDMQTSLGGWTVVMRRIDGQLFNKSWDEYKNGFGALTGSFWFGNEKMHQLTQHCMYEAKMEHVTVDDEIIEANYLQFRVHSEEKMYKLHLREFYSPELSPDIYMYFNDNQPFSTYDVDNDKINGSCSQMYGNGGFWFSDCHGGYMTGVYMEAYPVGNTYQTTKKIKHSSIKIRRINILSEGKPSLASSGASSSVNDGTLSTMIHTDTEDNPWWEVDLEYISYISGIRIINRLHAGISIRSRFSAFTVTTQAEESGSVTLCHTNDNTNGAVVLEFTCEQEIFARHVRVTQKKLNTPMNLQEIQIFGNQFIKQN